MMNKVAIFAIAATLFVGCENSTGSKTDDDDKSTGTIIDSVNVDYKTDRKFDILNLEQN